MGTGTFLEPFAVLVLLFGGAWINRSEGPSSPRLPPAWRSAILPPLIEKDERDHVEDDDVQVETRPIPPSLLPSLEGRWRTRKFQLWKWETLVTTPNTAVFRNRLLSRLLHKFPFLVECWYWALIYWVPMLDLAGSPLRLANSQCQVYQLGRAFIALTLVEGTVHVARRHALQLIEAEKRWHMFWEPSIQRYFLRYPLLMSLINWLYSYIHIPGMIAFLAWLYHYTITRNRVHWRHDLPLPGQEHGSLVGPQLYEARRRTMALCNLLAFVVFTAWPCMPPRLLSDKLATGPDAGIARKYGFVDTVHGKNGGGSVWTQNRFCNQYGWVPDIDLENFLLTASSGNTLFAFWLLVDDRRDNHVYSPRP